MLISCAKLVAVISSGTLLLCNYFSTYIVKKILKGSLDSISSPSPSEKIQAMGGKICLRHKGKTLLGIVNKFLYSKVCWKHPAMFCLYTFPAHNLNFHWRCKVMGLNPEYLLKHSFLLKKNKILNYRHRSRWYPWRFEKEEVGSSWHWCRSTWREKWHDGW